MKTANEIVTEYAIQFVKDHWEEILQDKRFDCLCVTNDLLVFIEELKSDINNVGWVVTELMDWFLDYNYYKDLVVHEFDNNSNWYSVIKINDYYIKWKLDFSDNYIFEFTELKTKTITYFEEI